MKFIKQINNSLYLKAIFNNIKLASVVPHDSYSAVNIQKISGSSIQQVALDSIVALQQEKPLYAQIRQ